MAGSGKKRPPYQLPHRGLLATAFFISLCLFGYGAESVAAPFMRAMAMEVPESIKRTSSPFWAILVGASLMGGALGAVIVQVFRDEDGGEASIGAFVGALAGPPIVLILLLVLLIAGWIWVGCPSA
jgi:hypothetical protein